MTTLNHIATRARQAALDAAEREAQYQAARARSAREERAALTAESVKRVLGFEAVPNKEDGTASVDEFVFWAKQEDYGSDLHVKCRCPKCGGDTWRYLSRLETLGEFIAGGMIYQSPYHQCPVEEPRDEPRVELPTLREQVERQVDEFDRERFNYLIPLAQVEALENIFRELTRLRMAYEQRNF